MKAYTKAQETSLKSKLSQHGIDGVAVAKLQAAKLSWGQIYQIAGLIFKDGGLVLSVVTTIAEAIKDKQPIDGTFIQGLISTYGAGIEQFLGDVLNVFQIPMPADA